MPHHPNPFSTKFTRPGAIAFLFDDGESVDSLVQKLHSHRWLGEIIGPHGTGKSTLLETLRPQIESLGRRVLHFKLTASQPKLAWSQLVGGNWDRETLVIIDGYEQLRFPSRLLLALRRQLAGAGMLVTAHRSQGFPLLYQTSASEPLAQALVEELVQRLAAQLPSSAALISRDEVAQALSASRGDLRDMLFRLYDLYESRKNAES